MVRRDAVPGADGVALVTATASATRARPASYKTASSTELDLLRGFELRSRGHAVELSLSSQRVIAFLAIHERTLQRPYVAGSLWSNSTDERAAASLRSALWRIPNAARHLVTSTGGAIRLSPAIVVDVVGLTTLSHELEQRPVAEVLRNVTGFEDDLLPDWYDDWLLEWRERWRHIRLHALEAIAVLLTAGGSYGRAIEAALAATRAEPLRESAHRVVIEAHLAEGNAGEAVRQFRAYERLLRKELGIAPSPDMRELLAGLTQR